MQSRIEPSRQPFTVIDSIGETVGVYATEEAAKLEAEHCAKEDAMYDVAKPLSERALNAHMQQFKVSREVALYWIRTASEVVG